MNDQRLAEIRNAKKYLESLDGGGQIEVGVKALAAILKDLLNEILRLKATIQEGKTNDE